MNTPDRHEVGPKGYDVRRHLRYIVPIALIVLFGFGLYSEATRGLRAAERERDLCRAAGIILTPEEWPSANMSSSDDAAPEYEAVETLLFANDFSQPDQDLMDRLVGGDRLTDSDATHLMSAYEARRPVMAAIRRAVDRPAYAFNNNPASQVAVYKGFARMRLSESFVHRYAILLAREGRYEDASRAMALGYRIALQAYGVPTHLGPIHGEALTDRVSSGLGNILQMAGAEPSATRAVREAIRSAPSPPPLSQTFRAAPAEAEQWYVSVRASGYEHFLAGFSYGDPGRFTDPALWKPGLSTLALRYSPVAFRNLVYHTEAAELRAYRNVMTFADKPYPQSRDDTERLLTTFDPQERSSARARLSLGVAMNHLRRRAHALARRNAVLAGADVLDYRARTGHFPDRLEQAMLQPPEDPFTGKPLMYRRKGRDGFIIFSAGPEGRKDPPQSKPDMDQAVFVYPRQARSSSTP